MPKKLKVKPKVKPQASPKQSTSSSGFSAKKYIIDKFVLQQVLYKGLLIDIKGMTDTVYKSDDTPREKYMENIHQSINDIIFHTCDLAKETNEPKEYFADSAIKQCNNIVGNIIKLYIRIQNEKEEDKIKNFEKVAL